MITVRPQAHFDDLYTAVYRLIDDAKSHHDVIKLYKGSHASPDPHPVVLDYGMFFAAHRRGVLGYACHIANPRTDRYRVNDLDEFDRHATPRTSVAMVDPLPISGNGRASLADVVPSLLAGLGVAGFTDRLGLHPARGACLLLVDGLGWGALQEHPIDAPFLTSLTQGREPIMAGFPATTSASVSTIGTGLLPGQHGIVGFSFAIPDGVLINTLSWHTHGGGERVDLRERFVPEVIQPRPTALERAAAAGVRVTLAVPEIHRGSGLNRAALRGGDLQGVHALGDLAATALAAMSGGERTLCYAYHGDLDLLGHVYGVGSLPWRLQLGHIDRLAAVIAEGLPLGTQLVVIADHGMVTVPEDGRLDFDTEPALQAGVRLLGGDARARYVYTEPGATDDVLAAWRELIGDRAWIHTRDEAIAAGWFGPVVERRIRDRIGDIVVAARTNVAVVRSRATPKLSRLIGHHGSLTNDEQLVPLLVYELG